MDTYTSTDLKEAERFGQELELIKVLREYPFPWHETVVRAMDSATNGYAEQMGLTRTMFDSTFFPKEEVVKIIVIYACLLEINKGYPQEFKVVWHYDISKQLWVDSLVATKEVNPDSTASDIIGKAAILLVQSPSYTKQLV